MVVKIFCDICGALIPEASEGEGEDAGNLNMGYGPWGEKVQTPYFDFDALCAECTDSLREAIKSRIELLRKTAKET